MPADSPRSLAGRRGGKARVAQGSNNQYIFTEPQRLKRQRETSLESFLKLAIPVRWEHFSHKRRLLAPLTVLKMFVRNHSGASPGERQRVVAFANELYLTQIKGATHAKNL